MVVKLAEARQIQRIALGKDFSSLHTVSLLDIVILLTIADMDECVLDPQGSRLKTKPIAKPCCLPVSAWKSKTSLKRKTAGRHSTSGAGI